MSFLHRRPIPMSKRLYGKPRTSWFMKMVWGIVVLAVLGVIILALLSNTNQETEARSVLTKNGYTNIVLTGYVPWACGDDTFSIGFIATNSQGNRIEGAVCSDIGKYPTIRFK